MTPRRHTDRVRQELEGHLEALVRAGIEDGLPLAEARRRARIAFGSVDVAAEECRDAAVIGRQSETLLFGVAPIDGASLVAAAVVMIAAVAAGAAWPLRRALRIDPVEALRDS